MTHTSHIPYLREIFRENFNEKNAVQMKAYMKGHFDFFGIKSPLRREITRHWLDEMKTLSQNEIIAICKMLWKQKEREFQMTAMDLLAKIENKPEENRLQDIRWFIENKSWWDTVDWLSSHLLGKWVFKFQQHALMREWNKDENMWIRRASIIYQLNRKEHHTEVLFENCKDCLHESEFFIRKAIGWMLRDLSKKQPERVMAFLDEYRDEMSNLTFREATKYLDTH